MAMQARHIRHGQRWNHVRSDELFIPSHLQLFSAGSGRSSLPMVPGAETANTHNIRLSAANCCKCRFQDSLNHGHRHSIAQHAANGDLLALQRPHLHLVIFVAHNATQLGEGRATATRGHPETTTATTRPRQCWCDIGLPAFRLLHMGVLQILPVRRGDGHKIMLRSNKNLGAQDNLFISTQMPPYTTELGRCGDKPNPQPKFVTGRDGPKATT